MENKKKMPEKYMKAFSNIGNICLHVVITPSTCFRVNLHSIVA